jgi:hypothetical protein
LAAAASLGAIIIGLATPAAAGPSIWVQCDGQPKPESTATTAARLATVTLLGGFGIGLLAVGETPTGRPVASGRAGVEACTAALADPALEPFWQRRVSILYARAGHRIDMDDPQGALADLREARGAADGKAPDVFFDRSIGVGAQLFEALLLAREGKHEEAATIAAAAAAKRPWSRTTLEHATGLMWNGPALRDDERALIAQMARLDNDDILMLARRLDASDDAKAAADAWDHALKQNPRGPTMRRLVDATLDAPIRPTPDDPQILAQAALAFARDGRLDRAEELMAGPTLTRVASTTRDAAPAAVAPVTAAGAGRTREELASAESAARREKDMLELEERARKLFPLIRALIDEGRGRRAAALSFVQANYNELPATMATADLAARLSRHPETQGQMPAFMVQALTAKARPPMETTAKAVDLKRYIQNLPRFQQVGAVRFRNPNGRGAPGYKEEPRKHGRPGVSLVSNHTHDRFNSDEVLLLRAAELAKAAGKPAFLVLNQSSAFHFSWGVLAHQFLQLPSTLEVDFVDPAALPEAYAPQAGRVIMADEVIAALGPVYIDLPAQVEAAKRARR